MAQMFAKKILEPFLIELRCNLNTLRYRRHRQKRKNQPGITVFEPKPNLNLIAKFVTSDEGSQKTVPPVDATCCLKSFPKLAFTPLARIPGYPASTVKPGIYFPANWRWFADKKDVDESVVKGVRSKQDILVDFERSLKLQNLARIEELKRQLRDESVFKGPNPKKKGPGK